MDRMARAGTLPVLLALFFVAEEGLRLVLRRIFSRHRRAVGKLGAQDPGQYGGLESLVSFSACLIAANRAVETEHPEPYIRDPLAAGLCGQEALEARRARDRATGTPDSSLAPQPQPQQQPGMEPGSQTVERRPIPRLIMRTKFFDDVVSVVTWRGTGLSAEAASHSCHAELAVAAASATSRPCLQVVLLGSGLDARPWRLQLPPGVRWFEVDRSDVLAAKRARLQAIGAQTETAVGVVTAAAASTQDGSSAVDPALDRQPPDLDQQQQKGHSEMHHVGTSGNIGGGGSWRYPLHVASWSCCAVDLQRRGWSQGLLEQGLDLSAPVLWVLEGLLYYLKEEDVRALLKEAASISAPGSVLAASVIRAAAVVCAIQESGDAAPTDGKNVGAAASAAAAAGTAAAAPRAEATSKVIAGPRGSGIARSSSFGKGGGSARGEGRSAGYNLNAEFEWRCREEIPKFFGGCGWRRTLACMSWLDAARSYGLPTAETTASSVFFFTASLA